MTHVDRLTLERTACFGRCPEYTVAVSGDGLVAFEGRRFVPVSGSFSWRVSPDKVGELVRVLNAAAFLSLANRYERREDGCPSVWTDLPTVTIVLQQDGLQKVVRHDHGCRGTPDPPLRWPQKSLPPPPPPPWGPFQPTWDQDFPFPYSLTALEDRIDEILGTAAWGGPAIAHSAFGPGKRKTMTGWGSLLRPQARAGGDSPAADGPGSSRDGFGLTRLRHIVTVPPHSFHGC